MRVVVPGRCYRYESQDATHEWHFQQIEGLAVDKHITLADLRDCWMPISPWPFIDRVRGRDVLLVYARYDLTFPVHLSREFLAEFARRAVPHEWIRWWLCARTSVSGREAFESHRTRIGLTSASAADTPDGTRGRSP